eukprot:1154446-Pelagomonas_calceolata.AAC.3
MERKVFVNLPMLPPCFADLAQIYGATLCFYLNESSLDQCHSDFDNIEGSRVDKEKLFKCTIRFTHQKLKRK